VLADSAARWLLVLHAILGAAAVGLATHVVFWLRKGRVSARSAWLTAALLAAGIVVGLVLYPTYRVEVRAAYLENPGAITAAAALHDHELQHVAAREHEPPPEAANTMVLVRGAAHAARWFDVKENWAALGLLAAVALAGILSLWTPAEGAAVRPVVLALAGVVCATTWLAAIIGLVTAAWRAV
jgi:hypothetical protein